MLFLPQALKLWKLVDGLLLKREWTLGYCLMFDEGRKWSFEDDRQLEVVT